MSADYTDYADFFMELIVPGSKGNRSRLKGGSRASQSQVGLSAIVRCEGQRA